MQTSNSLRWRIVTGGIICQFCAGMLYSWSLYVNPLVAQFNLPKSDITLTFSIATLLIPILMIFASKVLARRGPTFTVLVGAASLAAGLVISSFAGNIYLLYLGYGVLGGIGVGFIYGVPIATCAKWFPDKKGLISGLTVAGFGLGSIVFAPVATMIMEHFGPSTTFLVQAGITVVGMLIGAPMLKVAPDGFRPEGWQPPTGSKAPSRDYTSTEMLGTVQYWFLLVMYLFANVAGLFVIGHASPISQEIAKLTPVQAGTIVSLLSIANTLGRFASGAAADKIGAKRVVTIIYALDLILLVTLQFMTNYILIAIGIAGLAVCFGGMMGVYPSLVMDYFGAKYASTNYALVFLAYGVGGIVANTVASFSLSQYSGYGAAFLIIGASCAAGVLMSLISKRPTQKSATM